MNIAIVTGACGLIGSEAVIQLSSKFDKIIGIDNNMRMWLFGTEASIHETQKMLIKTVSNYVHHNMDIRDGVDVTALIAMYNRDIKLIIHTAAQPSHDWATKEPFVDFSINATGTLNLLEATKKYCPDAVLIYMSTNKVYGDRPNSFKYDELETRYTPSAFESHYNGFDETLNIDNCKHSLFGCSKLSADLYVQEYGKYFGMNTTVLRGGCLTGSRHQGTELHGFLNYLVKCVVTKKPYNIIGYKGKQVRDNIHAYDVISACYSIYQQPTQGEVFNIGGGMHSNCSVLEALQLCENMTGIPPIINHVPDNRIGDHIWWVTDMTKFETRYPEWSYTHTIDSILQDIIQNMRVT